MTRRIKLSSLWADLATNAESRWRGQVRYHSGHSDCIHRPVPIGMDWHTCQLFTRDARALRSASRLSLPPRRYWRLWPPLFMLWN